jgi:hypothetical protein
MCTKRREARDFEEVSFSGIWLVIFEHKQKYGPTVLLVGDA